jgi:hypothetical protein
MELRMAVEVTKTARYREAFSELGTDVSHKEFSAYCKKKWGIEPPESTFYNLKSQVKKEKAAPARSAKLKVPAPSVKPPTQAPKTPTAAAKTATCAVADLPTLLNNTKEILADFGGNKEALIKFIAAL